MPGAPQVELGLELFANAKKLETDLKRLGATASKVAKQTESGWKKAGASLTKFGKSAEAVGKKMTRSLTLPFSIAGIASVKFAADAEKAFAEVRTLLDESTVDVAKMEAGLRDLATQVPQTLGELTRGLYQTISAGVDASKAIEFLGTSARAAVAGVTDTFQAVDGLTTVLNAYQLQAEDASHVADIFFEAVKQGKTTFPELSQNIGVIASTAKLAGVSLEELFAALATITKGGIRTDMATVSLNQALLAFVKATPAAKRAAADFGLVLSAQTIKEIGLANAMKELGRVMAEAEAEGGDAIGVLAQIVPNIRALRAAANLAGTQQQEFNRIIGEVNNSLGAADVAHEKMADTLSNRFTLALETGRLALLEFGEAAAPMVEALVEGFRTLSERVSSLPKWVKGLVVSLSALMVVIGPLVTAFGFFSMGLGSIITLGGTLAAALNPLSLALIGVSAAVGIVVASFGGYKAAQKEAILDERERVVTTIKEEIEVLEDQIQSNKDSIETMGDYGKASVEVKEKIDKLKEATYDLIVQQEAYRLSLNKLSVSELRQKYDTLRDSILEVPEGLDRAGTTVAKKFLGMIKQSEELQSAFFDVAGSLAGIYKGTAMIEGERAGEILANIQLQATNYRRALQTLDSELDSVRLTGRMVSEEDRERLELLKSQVAGIDALVAQFELLYKTEAGLIKAKQQNDEISKGIHDRALERMEETTETAEVESGKTQRALLESVGAYEEAVVAAREEALERITDVLDEEYQLRIVNTELLLQQERITAAEADKIYDDALHFRLFQLEAMHAEGMKSEKEYKEEYLAILKELKDSDQKYLVARAQLWVSNNRLLIDSVRVAVNTITGILADSLQQQEDYTQARYELDLLSYEQQEEALRESLLNQEITAREYELRMQILTQNRVKAQIRYEKEHQSIVTKIWASLLRTFLVMVQQMIAKWLMFQAMTMMFPGTFGGMTFGNFMKSGFAEGGMPSAEKPRAGKYRGKGTGTSDDNLVWISDGEYIVPASATRKYHGLLEAMRKGAHIMTSSPRGFARGGEVGSHSVSSASGDTFERMLVELMNIRSRLDRIEPIVNVTVGAISRIEGRDLLTLVEEETVRRDQRRL